MIKFEELTCGFRWGAAILERLFSDEKKECVTLGLATPKDNLQIHVTKTGKIRIHGKDGEWIKPSPKEEKE